MPDPATGISDAEWEVIKILWDRGPLTAGQVVEALAPLARWKPRTVKTLLGRLVKKGAVRCEKQPDKRYLYRASISREKAIRSEARSFLSRVFDGALVPAVVTFLRESDLKPEQIERLRRILEQSERASTSESEARR
jgi:BlaI family transcriptional regulator, penicillinase repressor